MKPAMPSLEASRLKERLAEIQRVYLADQRPWVIGYSGGKDSSTALQLIWSALQRLPSDQVTKPVFIISSDTLVETPKIVDYLDASLARMNQAAQQQNLPFSAHKVKPDIANGFWVNLIGRGYPAPSSKFRWCTERLKINPANQFILEKVAQFGEVIMVLGVRKDESTTRAQVMNLHRLEGSCLSRHSSLPGAFVYTPIEDFSVDDVWTYLLQIPSPWGNDNRELVTMYRNAQAGECPLVVDTSTPSCGNSRFGCWVCTVVDKDKSMEAMVENGEEWLEPMLEYRDLLSSTQDPAVKRQVREFKRRNGQIAQKADGSIIPGPYKLKVRQDFLRRLLFVQRQVQEQGPNPSEELIRYEELEQIRKIWRLEEQDWEDSVPKIYREVYSEDLPWVVDEQPGLSANDRHLLDTLSARHEIPSKLVAKLLDIERAYHGLSQRTKIHQKISAIFGEDWRTEEEVLEQVSDTTS